MSIINAGRETTIPLQGHKSPGIQTKGDDRVIRCVLAVAEKSPDDAIWVKNVLTRFGHLVKHPNEPNF